MNRTFALASVVVVLGTVMVAPANPAEHKDTGRWCVEAKIQPDSGRRC